MSQTIVSPVRQHIEIEIFSVGSSARFYSSILDLLTSPELLAAAKKQFEQDTKEIKYFSLLPPGAKPPLDLNKEMMEKFRPAMRKFYLSKKVEFK